MLFGSRKRVFNIYQSRIYNIRVPRKVLMGVNIIKRQVKMSISRPSVDDPAQSRMHAQTVVTARGNKITEPEFEAKFEKSCTQINKCCCLKYCG